MTALTSISNGDARMVPLARPTDAIGSALRRAFARSALPDDLAALLYRLEQIPARRS